MGACGVVDCTDICPHYNSLALTAALTGIGDYRASAIACRSVLLIYAIDITMLAGGLFRRFLNGINGSV